MKQIVNVQTPLLTADEKSTLHSYELHCFQSFQNQLQIQLRSQNNLQTQFHSFLTTATKSLEAALSPPLTVEHSGRHWQTGDTEVDESDSDESEREHPDDTDVEETDVCKA